MISSKILQRADEVLDAYQVGQHIGLVAQCAEFEKRDDDRGCLRNLLFRASVNCARLRRADDGRRRHSGQFVEKVRWAHSLDDERREGWRREVAVRAAEPSACRAGLVR